MNTMKFIAANDLLWSKQLYIKYPVNRLLMVANGIDCSAYRIQEDYMKDLRAAVAQEMKRCNKEHEPSIAELDEVMSDIIAFL